MPPLNAIEGWLRDAGFVVTERRRVLRNKKLNLADVAAAHFYQQFPLIGKLTYSGFVRYE
jgi:hypothetical protein